MGKSGLKSWIMTIIHEAIWNGLARSVTGATRGVTVTYRPASQLSQRMWASLLVAGFRLGDGRGGSNLGVCSCGSGEPRWPEGTERREARGCRL